MAANAPLGPPAPSAARIVLPAYKETALFILRSVQRTGAHLPNVTWITLGNSLWEPPPNQGPFYGVYREWTPTGRSWNIRSLVDAIFNHYGDYDHDDNPFPLVTQALARQLRSKALEANRKEQQRCDVANRLVAARTLENEHQEGTLGAIPGEYGVDAPTVRGVTPARQLAIQNACAALAVNPVSQNLHVDPVARPNPPRHDEFQRITPVNKGREDGNDDDMGLVPQFHRFPRPPPQVPDADDLGDDDNFVQHFMVAPLVRIEGGGEPLVGMEGGGAPLIGMEGV